MTTPATPADLDLTACDAEPIRIPGSIQPHGILLALEIDQLRLLQISANAAPVLTTEVASALGHPLAEVLRPGGAALLDDLRTRIPEHGIAHLRMVTLGDGAFNAILHRAGPLLILELEKTDGGETGTLDAVYPQLRVFVDELQATPTLEALYDLAVAQIRRITGFDRAMLYRFDADWNGTVVAEDRNDALPTYLDLRFPASDIPAQARELYRLNRLRIIPDCDYAPVPLAGGTEALDLSFSVLRSVSPVHLEYMRNMGTPASMSISIIEDGRLWGLISCHNATPRRVPVHMRTACDLLGQVVAMQIFAKSRARDAAQRVERQAIQTRLLALMAGEEHFIQGLTSQPQSLLELAEAEGAAVVFADSCTIVGKAPEEAQIRALVEWLEATQPQDQPFASNALASVFPAAEAHAATASGMLAISISQLHPSYVLWFRPEVVRTVRWGGDPRKPAEAENRLHPRLSFEAWKEVVRGQAAPWTPPQIDAAATLRGAIVGIVMRKAEELAVLTNELKRSNRELEAFSYSVSHDLRAPFRHIVGYAELLKDHNGDRLDERSRRYIDTIIESAFSAGRLVDDLLGFSQMGRSALTPIRVDMNRVVDEVRNLLGPDTEGRRIDWDVAELPPAWGDPRMLRQVMQNLLSNAIKYTRRRDIARIAITGERRPNETLYHVADNGVGFDMAYADKLFGVFQRLHRVEDFEGTGIGLANVRRIMERHDGRAWAEASVGEGATFHIALPQRAEG